MKKEVCRKYRNTPKGSRKWATISECNKGINEHFPTKRGT